MQALPMGHIFDYTISGSFELGMLRSIFQAHQNKKHQFDGVGFPTLRVRNNELTLFFTGFWGFHLFKKYTIDAWQPKLEKK